jgi:hypothetical protein
MSMESLVGQQILVKTSVREIRGLVLKATSEQLFVKWGGDPTNVAKISIETIQEVYRLENGRKERVA